MHDKLGKFFNKKAGKVQFKQIVVPEAIECGKEVCNFLRKLDVVYELSKHSKLVFGPSSRV